MPGNKMMLAKKCCIVMLRPVKKYHITILTPTKKSHFNPDAGRPAILKIKEKGYCCFPSL